MNIELKGLIFNFFLLLMINEELGMEYDFKMTEKAYEEKNLIRFYWKKSGVPFF